ncbi:MAG: hypothetical protein EOO11_13095, partial [Chitinophagaceae bacterium]
MDRTLHVHTPTGHLFVTIDFRYDEPGDPRARFTRYRAEYTEQGHIPVEIPESLGELPVAFQQAESREALMEEDRKLVAATFGHEMEPDAAYTYSYGMRPVHRRYLAAGASGVVNIATHFAENEKSARFY